MAIGEDIAVHLRLDVLDLDAIHLLQMLHVDLIVEVANVPNNGVVLHQLHVLEGDDIEVACGRDEDVDRGDDLLKRHHLEALHARLQCADRVDLGDQNPSAGPTQGERATLAHVAVAANEGTLATDHHVGGAHDAIRQRVSTTVDVVKLRLRDAVVHVDRREEQLAPSSHLLQSVYTCGGLLANSLEVRRHPRIFRGILLNGVPDDGEHTLEFGVVSALGVRKAAVLTVLLFVLPALVD
mmetsp:Transcript_61254/g.134677  ORF Transcript_61254/g.134677 Transcript_61254/m.134677 type:complete len:239 (-) Transcript_61254:1381-2097(-)